MGACDSVGALRGRPRFLGRGDGVMDFGVVCTREIGGELAKM